MTTPRHPDDLPPAADAPAEIFLDAVLRPHRSLPPRGFLILMAVLGGVSFTAGMVFVLRGAWPVMGFLGLDVALVYLAFRLNYRSARRSEHVRLAGDALTIERVGVRGDRRLWTFQPYWARIVFEEKDEDENRLLVTSHGRSLALATFLGAGERRSFAGTLKDAKNRWREALRYR
jgi:uncharacterized membrane protein